MASDDNGGLPKYQPDDHVSTFWAAGRVVASTVNDFGAGEDPVLFQRQENQHASGSMEPLSSAGTPKDVTNATQSTLSPMVSKVMLLLVCFGKRFR